MMDDLISKQDALELVRDVCDAIMSCCESHYDEETGDEVYDDIREINAILKCNKEIRIALKNMPSAQPEQRWIPCSERLPEEDYCTGRGIQHSESVLVTIVHHANDDDVFVDMACTVDGKWQLTYPFDDDPDIPKWCEIIAWMPLPEPYKERREE